MTSLADPTSSQPVPAADEPLISVIVPVYNRAHMIARAVGSICNQSYRNLDIIVVDDCSTDDIRGAVAAIGDPRVRLLHHEKNGGASAARNTGVAGARGEFIAFHDSDDVSIFDRFAREMALMQANPGLIGVFTASIAHTDTDEANRRLAAARVLPPVHRSPLSGDLAAATVQDNFIDLPTMLLRRAAVLAAGPFDTRLRNNVDWDFTIRLTQQGPFGFIPQPLYVFSYHPRTDKGNDHLSHNARYSLKSFTYITGKLRRAGHTDAELGKHYRVVANLLIRNGKPKLSRRFSARAWQSGVDRPKAAAIWALGHMPGLYRRIRSLRFGG